MLRIFLASYERGVPWKDVVQIVLGNGTHIFSFSAFVLFLFSSLFVFLSEK